MAIKASHVGLGVALLCLVLANWTIYTYYVRQPAAIALEQAGPESYDTTRGEIWGLSNTTWAPPKQNSNNASIKAEQSKSISQVHRYVIEPADLCSGREITLLICVPVSRNNALGRKVIRDTWGGYSKLGLPPNAQLAPKETADGHKNIFATNVPGSNVVLLFFIGSGKHPSGEGQAMIEKEAQLYEDIVQEDFQDTYVNLTLKSISILRWASQRCPQARYVAKIDDDIYVNIPLLVKDLEERTTSLSKSPQRHQNVPPKTTHNTSSFMSPTQPAFIVGSRFVNAPPIRDVKSKWYTPIKVYSGKVYPTYVSGTAYAMTGAAAARLYEASRHVPLFWMEDIYVTGMCARYADVSVLDDGRFSFIKPSASGCTFRNQITGHRYSTAEIQRIHSELNDPKLKC